MYKKVLIRQNATSYILQTITFCKKPTLSDPVLALPPVSQDSRLPFLPIYNKRNTTEL